MAGIVPKDGLDRNEAVDGEKSHPMSIRMASIGRAGSPSATVRHLGWIDRLLVSPPGASNRPDDDSGQTRT
jgi:hypothetical protein